MKLEILTFNPFYENTYILYDETGECVIIDPGCSNQKEEKTVADFIENNNLQAKRLINTHCHIDHILGNSFVAEKYKLPLEAHKLEMENLRSANVYAESFGMPAPNSPDAEIFLDEGHVIEFGNTRLKVLFTPGHSAGHVAFYNENEKILIGGDVLFHQSIGRTDLPGGNFQQLIQSIKEKLFPLGDDVTVYPGHGPATTIGYEKVNNPFLTNEY